MEPASGAIAKLTFTQRRRSMSETLITRCEVSEELSVMNSHQSSPVLSLSKEEVIINSSRSDITKNFPETFPDITKNFAREASLRGQIFMLRTSNFRGATIRPIGPRH